MKGQHFFYVGLGVLLLAVLVACGQVPIAEPEPGQPAPAEVVAPQPYDIEVLRAQRYTSMVEPRTDSSYYAANPELMVAQRYTPVVENEGIPGPSLLDADPAQLLTHRSAEVRKMAETLLLAANPELMVAQRYATPRVERAESYFLTTNPELMVARRYIPLENEVDPDGDIGLLEFFTVPNEANGQRTIERKAEEDIGLLEFFKPQAIKDEVSQPESYDIEMLRIQRYAEAAEKRAEAAFLAANPELLKAHPPTLAEEIPESAFLAANPELMVARRYIPLDNKVDLDSDLGLLEFFRPQTIKEVSAPDQWNHLHHPGR